MLTINRLLAPSTTPHSSSSYLIRRSRVLNQTTELEALDPRVKHEDDGGKYEGVIQ